VPRPAILRRLLVPLVLLAFVATGCGERSEPLGEVSQPYPVTVEGAGDQPTVVEEPPRRIVAVDAGSAELLRALGVGRRLVGIPAGVRASRRAREVLRPTGEVDVGEVVRLEPDLIVATPRTDALDVALARRESGARLYVQPDSSVNDVLRGTIELGFLVGEPVRARQLRERILTQVESAQARVAGEPVVSAFVDTGFFITIPQRSLLGDLIRRARGESAAGAAPRPEPISRSRLRQLDPDVYLATSESRVTLRRLRADPRTAELTAVQQGRFVLLPSDLVLRPGPRIGRALEQVARALHPDAFG
jgi:iron complex transport system substrate-binding protein